MDTTVKDGDRQLDIVSYILARKYTDKRIADIDVSASTEESLRQIEAAKQQALSDITSEKDDSISDIGDAVDGEIASIQSEGQTQISSVSNAGTQAVSQVNEAGTSNVQSIQTEGVAQKTQIQTAGQDAISDISTVQTEAIEEIESQTTSSVNSVEAEGTNQINAVQQAAESEITDIQSEGQKQQSAISGAATQAFEAIGLTEQAAIAQVKQAGTTQVGNVNDAGNAKIAEINEANSHSPQINQETGKWQTWDAETESYVDTEIDAQGPQGQPGQNGADGAKGEQGEPGVSAGFGEPTATVDDTSGTPSVIVTSSGPDTAKVFNFQFSGLKGADGANGADGQQGEPGQDGAPATIQIGTVSTLEPGEQATVENVGTENAAILNFGIPKGEQGEPGTGGGGQGIPAGGTTGQVLAKASDSDYDTQWVDVEGGTTTSVSIYSGQATGEQTDIEVLSQIAPSPRHGDIGIVTHDIYDEIDSSNAYVYNTTGDANVWQPLNSKYNAEDVYFASNLVITSNIGVQTIDSSGSKTLDTAGKNLKQVLDMIVAEELNPSVSQPSVSVTLSNSGAKEVGTNFTPNYSCNLNPGSYQYGPATGVTATSWSISDTNSNSSNTQNGSLTAFQVIEGTNYRVSATVQHTSGAIPVTNLGNEYASGQIKAGSKSANSANVTGYRNTFYGTLTTKDSLPDSTVIRGLSRSNKQLNNGSKFSINIPVGAIRVVIAYPATLRNLTSVADVNGMGAEISSSFVLNTIQVAGENNYNPVDYKVYILDYANTNDTANTYNVTI